ncbi:MAG TPA: phosphoribosylaminoimidazolesuccinocarboxamide synthase, partial [Gaiellaceae bacterium]
MPEAAHVASGKVREIYALDEERLLLVASDRISTFDVVLPTEIPDKGRVLTGLSGFWFARTAGIVPNHLLALRPDGRSTECRRLEMLPLECVVRGYLSGSGWKDYRATGSVCGHELPEGLVESAKLPEPLFTPSTKAQEGHDENIDRARAVELVGEERFDEVERVS